MDSMNQEQLQPDVDSLIEEYQKAREAKEVDKIDKIQRQLLEYLFNEPIETMSYEDWEEICAKSKNC